METSLFSFLTSHSSPCSFSLLRHPIIVFYFFVRIAIVPLLDKRFKRKIKRSSNSECICIDPTLHGNGFVGHLLAEVSRSYRAIALVAFLSYTNFTPQCTLYHFLVSLNTLTVPSSRHSGPDIVCNTTPSSPSLTTESS